MDDQPKQIQRIDEIKWWIVFTDGTRVPVPLCPAHNLRLTPKPEQHYSNSFRKNIDYPTATATKLECAEGRHILVIPRTLGEEQTYVINRIDAKVFEKMPVMNFDDEITPVAKEKLNETAYWVKSKVTTSKAGVRLIIWAGDKSKQKKTQLFIEPELKRLSFDQNDDHPTDVFAKVEVTFANNIKAAIEDGK
jgi:hypothetical protein